MGDFRGFGLPCLPYGESVNGVPILHAGKHAETLGLADIQFDDAGRVTRLEGSNIFMLDSQFLLSGPQAATEADYQAAKAILEQHPGIHWDDYDEAMEQVIANEFRPAISSMENQVLALVPRPWYIPVCQAAPCPTAVKLPPGSVAACFWSPEPKTKEWTLRCITPAACVNLYPRGS